MEFPSVSERYCVSNGTRPSAFSRDAIRRPRMAAAVLTALPLLAGEAGAQTFDLTIAPPPTLTLNGQTVSQGLFTLEGATVFSDPGGVLTSNQLLDPADPADDVSIVGVIGSGSINFLISVPDDTEVIRVQGNFTGTIPSLPAFAFDATVGTSSIDGPTEYIWFLPQSSSQALQYQVTDLNGPTLGDNTDLFSPAPPVLALSASAPSLAGLTVLTLSSGTTNPWFVGVPAALTPAAAGMKIHGIGGCANGCTAIWNGGPGSWTDGEMWDIGIVPLNAGGVTFNALIDGGKGVASVVSLAVTGSVDGLTVDANDTLQIQSGVPLTVVDELTNDGNVELLSVGPATRLVTDGIDGSGSITLSGGNNAIESTAQASTLVFQTGASQTFRGGTGTLGLFGGDVANGGTLAAADGAEVTLAATVSNAGALLLAGDGSSFRFAAGAGVVGGTLDATGSGEFRSSSGVRPLLQDVQVLGPIRLANGEGIELAGGIDLQSSVSLESTGNVTDVRFLPDTTLAGAGSFLCSTAANGNTFLGTAGGPLSIPSAADHAFQGGMARWDGDGQTVASDGTLRAEGGIFLRAEDVEFDGTPAASWRVGDASTLQVATEARLRGGTLETSGSGLVRGADALAGFEGVLEDLTVAALVQLQNAEDLGLDGSLILDGAIELRSTGLPTELRFGSGVTWGGTGAIAVSNPPSVLGDNVLVGRKGPGPTLTVPAGVTFGLRPLPQEPTGQLEWDGNEQTVANEGAFELEAGVFLHARDVIFKSTGAGAWTAAGGAFLQLGTGSRLSGGTWSSSGSGAIRGLDTVAGSQGILLNVTNEGLIQLQAAEDLGVHGQFTNNGTVSLESTGTPAELRMGPQVTLSGTGSILFSAAPSLTGDNVISGSNQPGSTLTVVAGALQTIQGGQGSWLGNEQEVSNAGTLRVAGSTVLLLQDAEITSVADGVVQAVDTASILIGTGSRVSGAIETSAAGVFRGVAGGVGTEGLLADLTLDGLVQLQNGENLGLQGLIANEGTISLESTGTATELRMGPDVTLTGGGSIVLSAAPSVVNDNEIVGSNVPGTVLTVPAGAVLTLEGGPGGHGNWRGNEQELSNFGTVQAAGDVFLQFLDTEITNEPAGVVQAVDDATLRLGTGTRVEGGTIQTAGSGAIRSVAGGPGSEGVLADLTIAGLVQLQNGESLGLQGLIANEGTLSLESTGTATELRMGPDVTLTGGGSIMLSAAPSPVNDNEIVGSTLPGTVLTVPAGEVLTVAGGQGTWRGNEQEVSNFGTIQAAGGVLLQLLDAEVTNEPAGVLLAADASTLRLGTGTRVEGGTIQTSGSGAIRSVAGGPGSEGVLADLTITGLVQLQNGENLGLQGLIANEGTLSLESTGTATELRMGPDVTLTGGGSIVFSAAPSVVNDNEIVGSDVPGTVLTVPAGTVLTIEGGQGTWRGNEQEVSNSGTIQAAGGVLLQLLDAEVTNEPAGVVLAADASTIRIGTGTRVAGGTLQSAGSGTFRSVAGGPGSEGILADLTIDGLVQLQNGENVGLEGAITNDGTISLESTGTATEVRIRGGHYDPVTLGGSGDLILGDAPSLTNDNTISGILSDARLVQGGGHTLRGFGTVDVELENAGTLSPGADLGTLRCADLVTLLPGSELEIEIGLTGQDLLLVASGDLTLGGELTVRVDPLRAPTIGPQDSFVVVDVTSGTLFGEFDGLPSGSRVSGLGGFSFQVDYGPGAALPNAVVLSDFQSGDPTAGDVLRLTGTAAGGEIRLLVNGVWIELTTTPGMSAADVLAALADLINGHPFLAGDGVTASVSGGSLVITGGVIEDLILLDPGLAACGCAVCVDCFDSGLTNLRAVSESYDLASPEIGTFDADDVVVVNGTQIGSEPAPWTGAELGLLAQAELDAFTDGTDVFPETGPTPSPPSDCRTTLVEYTVDRSSVGLPASAIAAESASDGAASDTFGALFDASGAVSYLLQTDHLSVTPAPQGAGDPVETDLDALAWLEVEKFPVWFSLAPQDAIALGFSPADILVASGGGSPPTVFLDEATLGLFPGDDIDALAHDGTHFVLSLSSSSPSALAGGPWEAAGPAGLLIYGPGTGLADWATPSMLDLAPTDELNGVRILDPPAANCLVGSQPDPGGGAFPYFTLRLQSSIGDAAGRVSVPGGVPTTLDVMPAPNHLPLLFGFNGRPCLSDEFAAAGLLAGCLTFDPLTAVDLTSLPFPVAIPALPSGIEFTFEAVSLDLITLQLFAANSVTLNVF